MPGHRRFLCHRALHLPTAVSLFFGLCTPALQPSLRAGTDLAAPPKAQAESVQTTDELAAQRSPVGLDVAVEPPEAKPGELVTVTVRVKAEQALPDATLTAVLVMGLSFEDAEGEEARFDAASASCSGRQSR